MCKYEHKCYYIVYRKLLQQYQSRLAPFGLLHVLTCTGLQEPWILSLFGCPFYQPEGQLTKIMTALAKMGSVRYISRLISQKRKHVAYGF